MRNVSRYGAIFIAMLLTSCGSETAIKEAVRDGLKDPESAIFGEITQKSGNGGNYACATINARNSMGGYTGDQQAFLFEDENGWQLLSINEYSHDMCLSAIDDNKDDEENAMSNAQDAMLNAAGTP